MFLPINGLMNTGVKWIGGLRANGGGGEVCRNVSNFNGTDSYAEFDNDIVLSGDFEWRFSAAFDFNDLFNAEILVGNNSTTSPLFALIESNESLRIRDNSGASADYSLAGIDTVEGVDFVIVRESGVVECFANEISIGSSIIAGDITLNTLGAYINPLALFYKGTMRNHLVWTGGTSIAGTVLLDLPMDEDINAQTGNVDYTNRNGDADYNATGYNITITEECPEVERNYHVFVLGGQSNMVGRADYDGLGDYSERVFQLDQSSNVIQAISPLDHLDENAGDMGLTITFCNEYLASNPNVDILLVPSADGGTSFQSGDWGVGNTLYNLMKTRTATAMAIENTSLKGLLWHQGESDAGNATYETELDAQMNDYKSFCSTYIADIPIILGEMFQGWVDDAPSRQVIQDIINDTPTRVTRSLVASSNDLTSFDNLHFDSASLRTLGERYYEQYNNVITNAYEWIDGDLYIDGQKWID